MVSQKNNLFRKEALERSSSPERLDQIMQIVSPKKWLPLVALGSLVTAGLTWSIVGRIPIVVTGQGVLIYPSKVVNVESRSSGQLLAINVHVGDFVRQGEVLATIDNAEIQKQLQQQRAKLAELQAQNQDANSLQGQRSDLEQREIEQQRQNLQQRIQEAQALTPILRDKGIGAIAHEQQNLQQRLQESLALAPTLKDRLQRRKSLQTVGAISSDAVLEAEQTYLDSIKKIADLEDQLKELDVKQVEAEKSYRDNLSQIADFKAQLRELDTKGKSLAEQNFASSTSRQNQIQEVQRTVGQLELQSKDSQIISKYSGRILEITATPGQVLSPGFRVGSIEAQEPSGKLASVAFFPVGDGKKVQKGMKVQITPTTVKRERFGGIVGAVTSVSAFPVTKEGASSLVGNPELVQSLMSREPQLEVFAELQPDSSTFSGYLWSSSKGPRLQMTPGTTTSVRVTVEERAPISFVFPILRSWSGID